MTVEPDARTIQVTLGDADTRERLSRPAVRAFADTVRFLRLGTSGAVKLLGGIPKTDYDLYMASGANALTADVLERISLTLGITKALRLIFADDESGRGWLRGANSDRPFQGESPLRYIPHGPVWRLYDTRAYLDVWHGN